METKIKRDAIARSIDQCAIIRVNLLDLETSINQPQFKSLMNGGWEVMASFAIEDKNIPFLMLILKPPTFVGEDKVNYFYLVPLVLIAISSVVHLFLYTMRYANGIL